MPLASIVERPLQRTSISPVNDRNGRISAVEQRLCCSTDRRHPLNVLTHAIHPFGDTSGAGSSDQGTCAGIFHQNADAGEQPVDQLLRLGIGFAWLSHAPLARDCAEKSTRSFADLRKFLTGLGVRTEHGLLVA